MVSGADKQPRRFEVLRISRYLVMDSEDSDNEGPPPLKRPRYERSSTPIRESPPGMRDGEEEAIFPLAEQGVASSPDVPDQAEEEPGPDYFGLSNEAMGKFNKFSQECIAEIEMVTSSVLVTTYSYDCSVIG